MQHLRSPCCISPSAHFIFCWQPNSPPPTIKLFHVQSSVRHRLIEGTRRKEQARIIVEEMVEPDPVEVHPVQVHPAPLAPPCLTHEHPSSPERADNITDWSPEQVGQWLANLFLPDYIPVFHANHVNGNILLKLDRESLKELVPSVGHRILILEGLAKLVPTRTDLLLGPPAAAAYLSQRHEDRALLSDTRMHTHGGEQSLELPSGSFSIRMSFIDRIRFVHNEFVRVRSVNLKADRQWRKEVCHKIGLRIDENKVADSLRWHDNLFQIAFREGELWRIQEEIFSKWLRWEIKGQRDSLPLPLLTSMNDVPGAPKRRRRGEGGSLSPSEGDAAPAMPLLPWRALQGISNRETVQTLLTRVMDGELSMKEMEEHGNIAKSFERMQSAFTELTRSGVWEKCEARFPPFTTNHVLEPFMKEFQRRKSNEERKAKVIPQAFVEHVQSALLWEASSLQPHLMCEEHRPVVLEKADLEEQVDEKRISCDQTNESIMHEADFVH